MNFFGAFVVVTALSTNNVVGALPLFDARTRALCLVELEWQLFRVRFDAFQFWRSCRRIPYTPKALLKLKLEQGYQGIVLDGLIP